MAAPIIARSGIIETADRSIPVGYAIMAGIDNPNQSIELRRIAIADKGNGFGKEALRLIKKLVSKTI